MLGLKIARLLDSTWTFFVLLFGSIICIVYASGYAAGTVYPSESWMNYGWPVGFGLMAGAAFVAAFTWNWVRLLEVALMSLAFAGAYREASVWSRMEPTRLWVALGVVAGIFMFTARLSPKFKNDSPSDRMMWPWIATLAFGVYAGVYFWSWTMLFFTVVVLIALLAVAGSLPTTRPRTASSAR